jgi:hypothetical protein
MAKRSKAKAKRAKTAKTKKAKTAGKTTKNNKTDPCAAQQQAFEDAQLVVDNLNNEINDPDIPPKERVKAERDLRTATLRLATAQTALDRCRRQHP